MKMDNLGITKMEKSSVGKSVYWSSLVDVDRFGVAVYMFTPKLVYYF